MNLVIGTAGHIDHGKTALIKALTGTDADRLPEEKQRGITIDLGFAELDLGDLKIAFVDVPGHERFVRNMLAGASGIDMVMLVVAADEGVMPQTCEHFDICRLLDVGSGLIVLTKKDLVDEELLEIVRVEITELVSHSFLQAAPIIAVSSRTGDGIDELQNAIRDQAAALPLRTDDRIARLHIDRSFTIKGFGTVVTGTLASGEIRETAELEVLPISRRVRVRGLQTHGRSVPTARAGQRVAVNLVGIDHSDIERGMVLAEKNILRPTQMLDTLIEVLADAKRPLRTRQRVRVNIGAREVFARVQVLNSADEIAPGEIDLVQLRLESPVAVVPGDRFVLRSYSPQTTIAGGAVLDVLPTKHRRRDVTSIRNFLATLHKARNDYPETVRLFINETGKHWASFADLHARTALRRPLLEKAISDGLEKGSLFAADRFYLSSEHFETLTHSVIQILETHHKRDPLSEGMQREALREKLFRFVPVELFRGVLRHVEETRRIRSEREIVSLSTHSVEFSQADKTFHEAILKTYLEAGLEVPKFQDVFPAVCAASGVAADRGLKLFRSLVRGGVIIKVTDDLYFAGAVIEVLVDKLRNHAADAADWVIDVAGFKDIACVSRKYAIPLLEYFDREKFTQRVGDKRLIAK